MKKEEKQIAINLRNRGYSLNEISQKLIISKGTASLWLRELDLNEEAKKRIKQKSIQGFRNSLKSKKKNRELLHKDIFNKNIFVLNSILHSKNLNKLLCSILYWCEGNKDQGSVRFTNSDPAMIKIFITLFRKSFRLDEARFRACIHIHEYHNDNVQKKYWSKITNIPIKQFSKSYKKSNTGPRSRKNYQGCISVRYNDTKISKELNSLWRLFADNYLGE